MLREIIDDLIDEICSNVESGDYEFDDNSNFKISLNLNSDNRNRIIERFRQDLIRFVDEQINTKPTINVVLKKGIVEQEMLKIAENIQALIEKLHNDKVDEVVIYE